MLCLKVSTDAAWADLALSSLDAVLVDHAHCEMKAASNALALAARHPSRFSLVRTLSELAREELDHFERVLTLLERRGLPLGEPRVDEYAAELRRAAGAVLKPPKGSDATRVRWALVDRLLVGAVIEARSCERFKIMIEALERRVAKGDESMSDVLALYRDLFPAEARHYRLFVELAHAEAPGEETEVLRRLAELSVSEARIVKSLETSGDLERATVHG